MIVWQVRRRASGASVFRRCMPWHADEMHPVAAQIEALKAAGCTEVILAINYRPEVRPPCTCHRQDKTHALSDGLTRGMGNAMQVMMGFIDEWQEKLGVKIVCSQVKAQKWRACTFGAASCTDQMPT